MQRRRHTIMTQTPIVKNKKLIKVIDQKLAEKLITSGFSYIKEGKFYAFADTFLVSNYKMR